MEPLGPRRTSARHAFRPTVAIVGGGFTGAAVAYHLIAGGAQARIIVFEPRSLLGAGLAYGGADPAHRINVPASRMSLSPDDEGQFARWLETSGTLAGDPEARYGTEAFARRRDFGRYVDERLQPHVRAGRLEHVRETVVEISRDASRWRLRTADGAGFEADFVALATTHPPPSSPRELTGLSGDVRLIANGLADHALDGVGTDDRVLIIGAGLTAADLVASLEARGHRGMITMMSRRGLRSRGHGPGLAGAGDDFVSEPSRRATELLIRVRAAVDEAERVGRTWRPVFDALRIQGQAIWSALEPEARRRVVRHLRPFWDPHRFRIAPQLDEMIARKLAEGSLSLRKARLGGVKASAEGIEVELRDRRGQARGEMFDRVIVATGPAHGAILVTQPALQGLAEAGLLTLDATGLGLTTSREGRAIAASGEANESMYVAGPLARGAFGELMGLPHVAIYARFIAEQLARAARDFSVHAPAPTGETPMLKPAIPNVFVKDFKAALAYYTGPLGFKVLFAYGDEPFYGHVARDQAILAIRHVDKPVIDRTAGDDLLSAFIEVSDVNALHEELKSAGVRIFQPPRREPWGMTSLIVNDPDGNLICFASAPL